MPLYIMSDSSARCCWAICLNISNFMVVCVCVLDTTGCFPLRRAAHFMEELACFWRVGFYFTFLWAAEPDHWLRALTSLTDASLTAWVWLPSCFLWQTGGQLSGTEDPASLGLCLMMPSKSKHQRAVCQTLLIAEIAQHGQMHFAVGGLQLT